MIISSDIVAYIGLGSNLGEREAYLQEAVGRLMRLPKVEVISCSPIYETDPVGLVEQPPFLNLAARVRTAYPPHELLRHMQQIEHELGRTREIRFGPRTIDLDLLLYGDKRIVTPELIVPHPRMFARLFVLVPLLDILPPEESWYEAALACRQKLDGKGSVRCWKVIDWPKESGLFAN